MRLGKPRRERARLGVDDEVDAALTVERDPFRPVLRNGVEPHAPEQVIQRGRVWMTEFDELEPVRPHGILGRNRRWGRVVWMSTFDAENQVRFSKEARPFVSVARGGALLPETKTVIAAIAKHRHFARETDPPGV